MTGTTGWGKAENINENFSNNASKNESWLTKNRGSDQIYYKRAGNGTLYYISKTDPNETTWNEEDAITVAEYETSRSNTPTANVAPTQNAQLLPLAAPIIDGGREAPLPPSPTQVNSINNMTLNEFAAATDPSRVPPFAPPPVNAQPLPPSVNAVQKKSFVVDLVGTNDTGWKVDGNPRPILAAAANINSKRRSTRRKRRSSRKYRR